jgi:hypothetical protein
MAEDPHSEFDINTVRRVSEEIATEAREDALEDDQRKHSNRDNVQRAEAAMDEDLIDHHLRGERCQQGKELQHERSDDHVRQLDTMASDERQEPRKAEPLCPLAGPAPPGEKHRAARPASLETISGEHNDARTTGLLYQRPRVVGSDHDEVTAITTPNERWQRNAREPPPLERHFPSPEAEMPRRSQQDSGRCRLAGHTEPMPKILGISGEAVEAGDDG